MGTVWTDIELTLARIDSMNAGAAAADAAELARIVAEVRAIAERLTAAFAPTIGLAGYADQGSQDAANLLASDLEHAASALEPAASALSGASDSLASSVATRGRIAELGTTARWLNMPELFGSYINAVMVGTYNSPMSQSASTVAENVVPFRTPTYSGLAGSPATTGGVPTGGSEIDSGGRPDGVPPAASGQLGPAADSPIAPGLRPPVPAEADLSGSRSAPGAAAPAGAGGPPSSPTGGPAVAPASAPASPTTPIPPGGGGPASIPVRSGGGPVLPPQVPVSGPVGIPAGLRIPASDVAVGPTPGAGTGGGRGSTTFSPAASQAAQSASSPQRSSGGMPAAAAPGAVRSRDDDERRPAPYLRSVSEGELLLGEQPMVTPAVLAPPEVVDAQPVAMIDGVVQVIDPDL